MLKLNFLQILISFALIEVLTLVSLTAYWRMLRGQSVESSVCFLENEEIFENENFKSLKHLFNKDVKSEGTKYCLKISDVLFDLVNKATTNRYNSNTNPDYSELNFEVLNCFKTDKVADVLHLREISLHSKPATGTKARLYWGSESHSGNQVSHSSNNGEIHIKKSGKYFISLLLTERTENGTRTKDQILRQVVNRISYKDGTIITLLEHAQSDCTMQVGHAERASNSGAVFHLEEHDRIYVATSHPYNTVVGSPNNHFSIFKL